MTTPKQIAIALAEIQEVDAAHNLIAVNECLAKGWLYLGIRITTRETDNGKRDYATYILGRPSE